MRLVRHAPLERCMYCHASAAPRTEEHLIPRALGGRLTLRDAVCESCRRITGELEQATLDREFLVPKTLLALKRRRARGAGPRHLPAVELVGADVPSTLTADTFPRGFSLPTFARARLLTDADAPAALAFVDCHLNLGTPTRQAVAARPPLADPPAYAHAIAKWAYALAIAERGLDCCDTRPLRALLLGERLGQRSGQRSGQRADVFDFVGTSCPRPTALPEWLHDFAVHETGPWLTVTLALFASAGMTPYEIVIGRR